MSTVSNVINDGATPQHISAVAGSPATQYEIDFGDTPVDSMTFVVPDVLVTVGSFVRASQAGIAATGRQQDENEMDHIDFACFPANGSFSMYAKCSTGRVHGKWVIYYTRS